MTIEVSENTVAFFFVALPKADWLAHIAKTEGGGFHATYRFRYWNSPEPWDQKDRKKWYTLKADSPPEEAIKEFSDIADHLARVYDGQCWKLIRGLSTLDQFMDEFINLEFAHCKSIKPGELLQQE